MKHEINTVSIFLQAVDCQDRVRRLDADMKHLEAIQLQAENDSEKNRVYESFGKFAHSEQGDEIKREEVGNLLADLGMAPKLTDDEVVQLLEQVGHPIIIICTTSAATWRQSKSNSIFSLVQLHHRWGTRRTLTAKVMVTPPLGGRIFGCGACCF